MSEFRSSSERAGRRLGTWILGALSVLALQCDESLPPREQPQNVMSAAASIDATTYTVTYGWVQFARYKYILRPIKVDQAPVSVTVTNLFDEVLQDSAVVRGNVVIWDIDRPTRRCTLDLRKASISPSPVAPGDVLTVLPHAKVALQTSWNQQSDTLISGSTPPWFFEGVSVASKGIQYYRDNPRSSYRSVTTLDPVRLGAQATVQIFAKAGRVVSSIDTVSIVYILYGPWEPPG